MSIGEGECPRRRDGDGFFLQLCIEAPAMDIIGAEVLEKMHENPNETGKFSRFFEEKGFYIILFLCVAAIGIAGYVLFLDPANTKDQDIVLPAETDGTSQPDLSTGGEVLRPGTETPLDGGSEIPVSGGGEEVPSDHAAETDAEPAIDGDAVIRDAVETIAAGRSTEPKDEAPETAPAKEEMPQESAPTFFVRPVSGEVLREFSGDELVYDRTMGDWRTHNGVDFQAADGTLVCAIADGTVEDVYRDEYYGTGILVDHGGGLKSVYLGLIENATVSVGQQVLAGETIGAVSTAALFESLEQAHLHVELSRDGVRVNPLDYIPE